MMPLPPETERLLATSFVILGFLGVVLLRGKSFKSKIIYLLLLLCVLISAAAVWYAISSVHILSDLETYQAGRPIRITVSVLGTPYVGGTFIYQNGPYSVQKSLGYSIYKLDGSNWVELNVECRDCVFRDCVNGEIVERAKTPPGLCQKVSDRPYLWNQTVYVSEPRECAGKPFTTYVQVPAGPGKYKAEICYGKAFNFDWDMPFCSPLQNVEPTCTESQFWIR